MIGTHKSEYDYEAGLVANILARMPAGVTHGSYMPGVNNPYVANDPQSFTLFDAANQWFVAQTLPVSDIDDVGRVNPQPLLRVEAVQKGTMTSLAKIDATATNSRDLHCRECHAKGQIAANPGVAYTLGDGTTLGAAAPTFWDVKDLAALDPDSHIDPDSQEKLVRSGVGRKYECGIDSCILHALDAA